MSIAIMSTTMNMNMGTDMNTTGYTITTTATPLNGSLQYI